MTAGRDPRVERQAWLGVAFFVLLGVAVLVVDPGAVIGWGSLLLGLLSGAALVVTRRRGPRPPAGPPPTVLPRTVSPRPQAAPGSPAPVLTDDERRRVDEIVAVLDRAGVWAPRTPDPALLHPPVADLGPPVTVDGVLQALDEVPYHHPDVDPAAFTDRLARHRHQVEQTAEYLREQVADLARLAGGRVPVEVLDVRLAPAGTPAGTPAGAVRTRLDLRVGGEPLTLDYLGVAKYLSTVAHVHLARALRRAGAPRRIAWLHGDDVLLAGLQDVDLDALNTDLGLPPADPDGAGGWTWVDECEPVALGEAGRPG